MANIKFDIEKFDGRINFGLWQVQVKDVLIQAGLYKVGGKGKWKKNSKKTVSCWRCGQSGHLKRDCKVGGASSASGSDGAANFVSYHPEDDSFSL